MKKSETHTTCPWKGQASYYHIEVEGEVNQDAAWTYPHPKEKAQHIKDHVAFWKGVEVVESYKLLQNLRLHYFTWRSKEARSHFPRVAAAS